MAVLVISPVLFAMIEHKPDQVDIAQVLQDVRLRWGWSFGLALTTFVPLVQLAAVHGAQPAKNEQAVQPAVQSSSVQSVVQSTVEFEHNPDAQSKLAQVNPEDAQQARLLKSEGLTNIQIAAELGVHRNTVGALLKRTNGHKEPA